MAAAVHLLNKITSVLVVVYHIIFLVCVCGVVVQSQSAACGPGQFFNLSSSTCSPCIGNTFCSSSISPCFGACIACPSNTLSDASHTNCISGQCMVCPVGFYCGGGLNIMGCAPGTYSSSIVSFF